jgi:hypothetical protein
MSQHNPLQKYYRQPKLFVNLPSKGLYYEPGNLKGDYNNMPIFGMTGMDEIIFKTPDALFNGEASSKVIESCCPYISDARTMPSIDVDAILVAIRMATYGETMSFTSTCSNCTAENDFDVDLKNIVEYYSAQSFNNTVPINDEITVKLKPLTYNELNNFSLENFKLQRMLFQINGMPEADQQQHLDDIYKKLAEIQVQLFMLSIDSVQTPDGIVQDYEMIQEWLQNSDRDIYNIIKLRLEENKKIWSIPKQHTKCDSCGHESHIEITLDQSNFFG